MRLLSRDDLRTMGIAPWSKNYIRKLVKAGKFPAPIRIGAQTLAWDAGVIEAWLEEAAQRPIPEVQLRTGSQVQAKVRAKKLAKAEARRARRRVAKRASA